MNEEKQVNETVGLVPWESIPQDLKEALLQHLIVWTDNQEIYFNYDKMEEGLWVPQDEGQDELLDWGDLHDMGLVFALGYDCLLKNAYLPVTITGVCHGIWVGGDDVRYSPETVNHWIQVLRTYGYQVEGLTK